MSTPSSASANITLRSAGPEDEEFVIDVYATTRAEEMKLVPWTEEQQRIFIRSQFAAQKNHYAQKYPAATHDIILADGRAVGRLYVARLDHEIRIVDITVLPAERNSGIGSYLIEQILDEAKGAGKLARIYVEEFNPSLRLFERLGFSVSAQHGMHLLLEWSPTLQEVKNEGD
ncbi:MAG TPA: GNAT family N-acetyltransferase [Pyrinomonadaceae bacterium]|nr:GNAT family N-acetyltransferase [Pyrinomonadaceae bacterium]